MLVLLSISEIFLDVVKNSHVLVLSNSGKNSTELTYLLYILTNVSFIEKLKSISINYSTFFLFEN